MSEKESTKVIFTQELEHIKIACSSEEKSIYGVDFKNKNGGSPAKVLVIEEKFKDAGVYYLVKDEDGSSACWYWGGTKYYSVKENALAAAKERVAEIKERIKEMERRYKEGIMKE